MRPPPRRHGTRAPLLCSFSRFQPRRSSAGGREGSRGCSPTASFGARLDSAPDRDAGTLVVALSARRAWLLARRIHRRAVVEAIPTCRCSSRTGRRDRAAAAFTRDNSDRRGLLGVGRRVIGTPLGS